MLKWSGHVKTSQYLVAQVSWLRGTFAVLYMRQCISVIAMIPDETSHNVTLDRQQKWQYAVFGKIVAQMTRCNPPRGSETNQRLRYASAKSKAIASSLRFYARQPSETGKCEVYTRVAASARFRPFRDLRKVGRWRLLSFRG